MSKTTIKDASTRSLITCENPDGYESLQFVKAGAGAGKTTSIKLRVLNFIKHKNLVPEKMVTITYTTKAANELLTRIREVIEEELKKETTTDTDRPKLEYALATLAYGKVSTFHSFCYDLLREYPVEFKIDPEAEIGDERGQDSIYEACYQKIAEEVLVLPESEKRPEHQYFADLSEMAKEEDIKKFFSILFANRDLKCLEVNTTQDKETVKERLIQVLSDLKEQISELDNQVKKKDDKLYISILEHKAFMEGNSAEEIADVFLEEEKVPLTHLGSQGNYKDAAYLVGLKALIKDAKTILECYSAVNDVEKYNLGVKAFPYFKELVETHKKNYGILDFFDCLYKVREGLRANVALRKMIQKRFEVIIVDEFQDSDPMQADIANMLAEDDPKKLFFVGDPKQSIYGFARADISVYQAEMDKVAKMKVGKVLNLTTNFRSCKQVLNFVNENFKEILKRDSKYPEMTVSYEEMDVDPKNEEIKGSVSRWDLEMETDGKLGAEEEREREGFCIGMKIKEMLKDGYKPGDFLILFRTGTAMGDYEDALDMLGIPVINTKSKDFLSQSDVMDMLNIISHVAFPKDKYFKECAEQSVLLKVIPQEDRERIINSDVSLVLKFETLFDLCQIRETAIQKKNDRLLQLKINLISLLESGLDSNNYDLKMMIHNLYKKATSTSFMDSIKVDDQSIYVETRKPNAVRLMTIHAAKGLESKVVILSAHKSPKDMKGTHFIDRETSEFNPHCSFLPTKAAKALEIEELQAKLEYIERKSKEEERRVLYVAVTRAAQNLIILNKADKESTFTSPLMSLPGIKFDETQTISFKDYEDEFKSYSLYKSSELVKIDAKSEAPFDSLKEKKNISQAVTKLIADKDLFRNIEGRKFGMEFGVLTHKVMETVAQHLFIKKNADLDIDSLVFTLLNEADAKFEEGDIEELKLAVKGFLKSPLANEIMAADSITTEIPFVSSGIVHGVIDMILQKGSETKILDWKSDQLKVKRDEIKEHYKRQIKIYKENAAMLTEKDISADCVYIFEKN